jgi:hypothetical protein
MKGPKISIAIPASIVADVPSLQLKTYKVGQIGRASAIYCVDEIFVYVDHSYDQQKKDLQLICEILRYMETPQYLRKKLFPLTPTLRFAGMLPPLNTPHHPTVDELESLRDGEYREGIVVQNDDRGSLVDIGVEEPLKTSVAMSPGIRRTFKIRKQGKEEATLTPVDPSMIPEYWGYKVVELRAHLGEFMRKKTHDLYIFTSKFGTPITTSVKGFRERLQESRKILIAFGSPREGLKGILAREGLDESAVDFNLNMIPGQGTLSVRTEEAVQATLAIVNLLIGEMDARFIRAANNDNTTPREIG